ncbi:MAG: Asp-tRNA(Asn)/Glu-tRNA(Gln) amidotransferase subunit GatC [Luminiphilus sp.]|nr:Asp-tRNA(Asn)/Glu-tRNA(Gln) amidotransferase subunit GatC [Luminiphilus sp.]
MTHATAVKEVAVLARLSISDEDIETATTEFNQTLALFDALSSVDTTQVTPMVNPLDAVQRLRIDSVETLVDREGLMRNAPAQDQYYFLVPRVLD